ncbi:DUF520 family protein [bacterium]|nr:MAG: DUF520 family protein [bacterium]
MAKDESFDITTGVDLQEVDNAVNQARKEIGTRFDFKNVLADIEYDRQAAKLNIHTTDEYKLEAIWQVLSARFVARDVPLKNIVRKFIKDQKYKKVQAAIQGDAVRVSSPGRDELQQVIAALKAQDYGIELKFGNYR